MFKNIIGCFSVIAMLWLTGCEKEEYEFGEMVAPSNLSITAEIEGQDANNPYGDGSGNVHFKATADNTITFEYVYNGSKRLVPSGETTYGFGVTGINTYTVTVVARGVAGVVTTETIEVEVLALYSPPADLLTMLTNDSSRTWRIKSEAGGHFGLGPVGGGFNEWYAANAFDKEGTGMYDDRYVFNIDGTFTHVTNGINDGGGNDPSGTIFGRASMVPELGVTGGTQNGDDLENVPYDDYNESWSLSAPGGVETISLTGLGFLGYYTGGDHTYKIESRSANEMTLRTTDGNNEFDWGFILIAED